MPKCTKRSSIHTVTSHKINSLLQTTHKHIIKASCANNETYSGGKKCVYAYPLLGLLWPKNLWTIKWGDYWYLMQDPMPDTALQSLIQAHLDNARRWQPHEKSTTASASATIMLYPTKTFMLCNSIRQMQWAEEVKLLFVESNEQNNRLPVITCQLLYFCKGAHAWNCLSQERPYAVTSITCRNATCAAAKTI